MQFNFQNVRIFEPKTEQLFLLYPLLFLALVPFELIFSDAAALIGTNEFLRRVLVNVLFLDSTHVFLTFFVLMRLPEFKTWSRDKDSKTAAWFYIRLLLIFFILLFYFNYPWPEKNGPWELELITMIIAFMPIQHSMYQIRGLSLAYNAGARSELFETAKDPTEVSHSLNRMKTSERWEKAAFILFFIGIIGKRVIRKQDNFISRGLNTTELWMLELIFYGFVLAAGLAFLKSLWDLGKPGSIGLTGKFIHLSRLIAYPLMSVSLIAANLISIFHGIDYYLVIRKMVKASKTSEEERKINLKVINLTLLITGILFTVLTYWRFVTFGEPVLPVTLLFLNGLVGAISYLHYYLDRIIFRMRDPEARRLIAPLILPATSARSTN